MEGLPTEGLPSRLPCGTLRRPMKVYINGKFVDEAKASVSVFDHGLLYGDGLFEGIRAYNGRVFRLEEHIDRLFYSAKAILMKLPMSHKALCAAVLGLIASLDEAEERDRAARAVEEDRRLEDMARRLEEEDIMSQAAIDEEATNKKAEWF